MRTINTVGRRLSRTKTQSWLSEDASRLLSREHIDLLREREGREASDFEKA